MDPVQRARYDAAVQRYHDNAAIQRERFESAMKDARRQLRELAERSRARRRGTCADADSKSTNPVTEATTAVPGGGELLARGFTVGHGGVGRPERETTPVQAILNRG